MAAHKHRPTQSGQAKPASSLHEAAVTLGSAGGKAGGPARAAKLTSIERSAIARRGAEATNRERGHTTAKGQVTHKSANEPHHPQGPPRASSGPFGGRQPISGPPRGQEPPEVNQVASGPSGLEAAPQAIQDIARYLSAPRKRNQPLPPDGQVGPEIDQAFGQATAALGRGRGRTIG